MTTATCRTCAVMMIALALLPGRAGAQTIQTSADVPREHRISGLGLLLLNAVDPATEPARQAPAPKSRNLGRNMAIGAAAGAGAGLYIGEVWFGQRMDIPHGPDMLLGAGIFAGVGAALGWFLTGKDDRTSTAEKQTISVAPILSHSKKAVVIRLSLK